MEISDGTTVLIIWLAVALILYGIKHYFQNKFDLSNIPDKQSLDSFETTCIVGDVVIFIWPISIILTVVYFSFEYSTKFFTFIIENVLGGLYRGIIQNNRTYYCSHKRH